MKTKLFTRFALMLGVFLVASWAVSAAAQSTRDRGAAIIFTPPKSDTVTTNLEKLNQKESPFKGMESSIRKPFDVFNTDSTRQKMVVPRQFMPPAQPMNQPSMKSILEKTAEEEFLKGENRQTDDPYDPFKSPDFLVDPYKKKPKTTLDRYYDRLENENTARTNRNSLSDILGDPKNQPDNFSKPFGTDGSKDFYKGTLPPAARWNVQNTNFNTSSSAPEGLLSRSARQDHNEKFQALKPNDPFERETRHRETRLENFKKLLDGNITTSPQNYNASVPPPAPVTASSPNYNFSTTPAARPGYLSPATTFTPSRPSSRSEPLSPSSSFTKSSGIIGTPSRPATIQSFGVSAGNSISTPIAPPPPQPKRAPATYNPPTRR